MNNIIHKHKIFYKNFSVFSLTRKTFKTSHKDGTR